MHDQVVIADQTRAVLCAWSSQPPAGASNRLIGAAAWSSAGFVHGAHKGVICVLKGITTQYEGRRRADCPFCPVLGAWSPYSEGIALKMVDVRGG